MIKAGHLKPANRSRPSSRFATTIFSRHASWPMSQNCTDAMTKTPPETRGPRCFCNDVYVADPV